METLQPGSCRVRIGHVPAGLASRKSEKRENLQESVNKGENAVKRKRSGEVEAWRAR